MCLSERVCGRHESREESEEGNAAAWKTSYPSMERGALTHSHRTNERHAVSTNADTPRASFMFPVLCFVLFFLFS